MSDQPTWHDGTFREQLTECEKQLTAERQKVDNMIAHMGIAQVNYIRRLNELTDENKGLRKFLQNAVVAMRCEDIPAQTYLCKKIEIWLHTKD